MMISLAGFLLFVRHDMALDAAQVSDTSPSLVPAFNGAKEWVNTEIASVMPASYELAIYNLAASFLVNYGSEQVFADLRKQLDLNNFKAGVISSAGDNGTGSTRLVPDAFKELSFAELQMLQDPWGRRYLMIAQQFGSLWGLT